jgi:predicted dithiol-disulfide oxidoreductase (DUF899 family)
MIKKQKIIEEARKHKLPPNTIEKDYVLNWLLAGISEANLLSPKKGLLLYRFFRQ